MFGFAFIAHAIGHSDRKGSIERAFSSVENNFLAGRTFANWADLNAQARSCCEGVTNAKPKEPPAGTVCWLFLYAASHTAKWRGWRKICQLRDAELVVLVLKIGSRGDVYK